VSITSKERLAVLARIKARKQKEEMERKVQVANVISPYLSEAVRVHKEVINEFIAEAKRGRWRSK